MNKSKDPFPAGLSNVFRFVAFNALSFQMILSSPMILFAKTLDASATALGIISGMMPLLVIFQIPAASHIPRYGYKRFVYGGWGIRVLFIFGMALVPVSSRFLESSSQLALLLFFLFAFNLSRGISSCAWLPWITSLIPPSVRGKFLVQEAAFINVASFVAFLLAAWCLGDQPRAWHFTAVFAFSAIMGSISLFFLKRIPEGETPEQGRVSTTPVPWLEIARYRPFRKLLRMNIAWSTAYGGLTAFTVAFLKTEAGMAEGKILVMNSVAYLGGLSSLWILGSRIDRLGSKPILTFSLVTWLVIIFGWTLLAGRLFAASFAIVVALQFLMGLGLALFNMANIRLAMATVPVMGRNHFFALFSVVSNLTLGLAPVLWGVLIDSMGSFAVHWRAFEWNQFTVFFALVEIMMLVTLAICRKLEEPEAAKMGDLVREILIESPQRVWLRLWPRE